jgi:SUKH-4 immunity protein of toxin-antitoxin system
VVIEFREMVELWGEAGLLYFPIERFGPRLGFDMSRLPPEGAMPADVPILFTAYIEGDFELFNVLEIQVGDKDSRGLIVLGAVPDDRDMLYCLDGDNGAIFLLGVGEQASMEAVNSSFANFVEFLYHLDRLIQSDEGKVGRGPRAARLRSELETVDPSAFSDPESWWSVAFAQLEGRI